MIGFEDEARRFHAEKFPAGPAIIAPLWVRNDLRKGGAVWYREIKEGRAADRAESEIRYQYEYGSKPESVLVVTWEDMYPIGDGNIAKEVRNF